MALFTKYDSVEGSSTADGFDKMVQTTSLQIKSSRTGQYEQSLANAQQRTTGNAVMGPITITQDVDKAYPKNCENMLGGKNCKKIEVFETLTVGGRDLALAQDRATWRETTPGALARTGNPLDLALGAPEAFFVLETPRGERFTRAGRFTLSAEGEIVDPDGSAVLGNNGQALRVSAADTRIEVLGDGTVRSENGPIGQLRVVRFANPQALTAEGDRLFAAPPSQAPEPVARPGIVQGAVEGSNVRPVMELTRMTDEMRHFQMVSQMAEKEGERLSTAVERILRRN
jgi:flagellar basal-body rod protein FlgF